MLKSNFCGAIVAAALLLSQPASSSWTVTSPAAGVTIGINIPVNAAGASASGERTVRLQHLPSSGGWVNSAVNASSPTVSGAEWTSTLPPGSPNMPARVTLCDISGAPSQLEGEVSGMFSIGGRGGY